MPLPAPATVPPLVHDPLPVDPLSLIVVSEALSMTHVPLAAVLPPTPEIVTVSPVRGDLPLMLLTVHVMGASLLQPGVTTVRLLIVTVPPA